MMATKTALQRWIFRRSPSSTNNYSSTLPEASLITHATEIYYPPAAPRPQRSLRTANEIKPIRAQTERYKHSPVPAMVHAINNNRYINN